MYFAPHEDNRIQLLSTVRSKRWRNNFYGTLEVTSTYRITVGHTIRIVDVRHVVVYTFPQCEASHGGCYRRKNFLLLVVGLCWSAYILLVCPSEPMRSNFPMFLLVHLPFSISIFSVQSEGVYLFCLALPYRVSLFSPSLSHLKVLRSVNPYRSTCAYHTCNPIRQTACKFLYQNVSFFGTYYLKITLPLNFTITSSSAKFSEWL